MRLGALFVALCMVLIAGSAGAALYFAFGFNAAEAVIVGIAVLTALGLYNGVSTGIGLRTVVSNQLRDLARGNADLARQVAEMGRRVAELESRADSAVDKTRAATDPLAVEISELGTLVKQLAESVAVHEAALNELAQAPPPPQPEINRLPATPPAPEPAKAAEPAPAPEPVPPPPPEPTKSDEGAAMLATIRGAIAANRVDLYLQPIVTLPQRKVRFYEAMTRLRGEHGELLTATDFISHAENGRLMPRIDNLVVFRCVQVVRRLLLKNREIGLFCNIAGSTLNDADIFPQLLEFMDANRAIAPSIVLEFTQETLRGAGPIETESLAALAERGFRFSLDNVTDLRIEPRELANRGFRFVKIPAALLLNRNNTTTSDIHPADMSDLLGRFGIDLIAEKIESEGSVVDLLDFDVRFGQGFLFSPPRPVRAEALQGIAERSDVVAREAPAAEDVAATRPTTDMAATDGSARRVGGLAQLARRI